MADLDLDKLEADAKSATPGPWKVDGAWIEAGIRDVIAPGEVSCGTHCYGGFSRITGENLEADYRHIANMDPATTLALIKRLRAAEAKVDAVRNIHVSEVIAVHPGYGAERRCLGCANSHWPCRTIEALGEES